MLFRSPFSMTSCAFSVQNSRVFRRSSGASLRSRYPSHTSLSTLTDTRFALIRRISTTSLIERIFKLGTIVCYTGDVTNPELKLVHVKHSREIKSYLLKQSEAARLKRRTLNTVDIGAHGADMADLDHDGIPDSLE